jgi:hypothetical protein
MKFLLHLMIGIFPVMTIFIITSTYAQQVYKCVGTDGKYRFSDVHCKGIEKTEVVRDRTVGVLERERQEARQRIEKMREEIAAKEKEDEARIIQHQAEQKREEEIKARETKQDVEDAKRSGMISDCMRDVMRRGASQNIKAEMVAACRSAGVPQRVNGALVDSIRECVMNVERTNASEDEKTRQVAICHGADVEPRLYFHNRRFH